MKRFCSPRRQPSPLPTLLHWHSPIGKLVWDTKYMDVTWICQNWYMDFSLLLHGFVKFDSRNSLSCNTWTLKRGDAIFLFSEKLQYYMKMLIRVVWSELKEDLFFDKLVLMSPFELMNKEGDLWLIWSSLLNVKWPFFQGDYTNFLDTRLCLVTPSVALLSFLQIEFCESF